MDDECEKKVVCVCTRARTAGGSACWAASAWLFEIPRGCDEALSELEAAAEAVRRESEGYMKTAPLEAGGLSGWLIVASGEKAEASRALLRHNHMSVSFAALSSWGMGPLFGSETVKAPSEPGPAGMSRCQAEAIAEALEKLAAQAERSELGEASQEAARDPARRPKSV